MDRLSRESSLAADCTSSGDPRGGATEREEGLPTGVRKLSLSVALTISSFTVVAQVLLLFFFFNNMELSSFTLKLSRKSDIEVKRQFQPYVAAVVIENKL